MSKKHTKNVTIQANEETERRIRPHIRTLGLKSIEQYKVWCQEHGFCRRLDKSLHERRREHEVAAREAAAARLAQSRRAVKLPEAIVEVFKHEHRFDDPRQPSLFAIWVSV